MCTRFVYNGNDTIIGFNFDIDLAVWKHTVIKEKDMFYIGIKMPDGDYHSFHGINKNGNVGTLLYVNGNEKGKYIADQKCCTISELTEKFIKGAITFDDALNIVQNSKIVYAPDATMQAMLSDKNGRVLIIEPGLGYRFEQAKYSLITNYSILSQTILAAWAEDEALLTALSNAALQDRRGAALADCRRDLLQKMFAVKDWYDSIESDYLDEIDCQVRRYTRATTQKLENLTNRDFSVRGNLNYLLHALGGKQHDAELVDRIQPAFQIYEQSFLSEHSLWYRRRPGKRGKTAPVLIEEPELDAAAEAQALQLLRTEYGRASIAAYVEQWLGDDGVCYSKDMGLKDDRAYIMSLLAVLTGRDPEAGFVVRELEGTYTEQAYTIPQLQITRKEGKK